MLYIHICRNFIFDTSTEIGFRRYLGTGYYDYYYYNKSTSSRDAKTVSSVIIRYVVEEKTTYWKNCSVSTPLTCFFIFILFSHQNHYVCHVTFWPCNRTTQNTLYYPHVKLRFANNTIMPISFVSNQSVVLWRSVNPYVMSSRRARITVLQTNNRIVA